MAAERCEIAIIGSGCRFPGEANSPSKLWELLRTPKVVASKVPALEGYYHEDALYHGHANVQEAYLLAGDGTQRRFDAGFFGIKPSEANVLDPQMRLLLETVHEALEDGGQTIDKLKGSDTAVYAGQMVNDYELLMYRDHENLGTYHATGTSRTMLSNRVSYFFDWHGPSMTIDTACSSSLVALHHAVEQLQSGKSRVAIVAGSNMIYDVGTFIAETNLQMLSPGGRSRMWDADADGYARGEGVAAVVLKTRQAAEADGDHIECIIRGTAVNQDGKTPGQTMPSASAQAQLIRDCYSRAGLDLRNPEHRPQYFEAHGTGTPAGDPIEAEAISCAFPPCREGANPLFVGSIKTVVGHTEGTAGLAGVMKASLALQNKQIPPNLLFNTLNPRIEPFYNNLQIPTVLKPWPEVASGHPLRASVNSFGFGGTNAHAILESYTGPVYPCQDQLQSPVYRPFVFSAFSEASLKSYLTSFCNYLRDNEITHELNNIAYSLDVRRTRLQVAATFSAATADELTKTIEEKLELSRSDPDQRVGVRAIKQKTETSKPRLLGVFTGQGAQWAQMGMNLVTTSATARSIIERLQRRLDKLPAADRPHWSLLQELQKDPSTSRVMEAAFSQPLCTAIQILQVDVARAAGIEFSAVVGHSSGEIGASYAAGLISAEDAICIAYYRGLYSALAQGFDAQCGGMMAVGTSPEDAEDLLGFPEFESRACLAAVNSSTSVTISGDLDALNELKVIFEDEHKSARMLKVDRAYHSHHMKKCSTKYLDSLAALNIQPGPGGRAVWFSSVYDAGKKYIDLLHGPYWDDNMVKPVLFKQALDSACASMGSFDLVIELGPHPALKGPALQTIQEHFPQQQIPYTSFLQRGIPAITSFSDALGYAWTHLDPGAVSLQNYDHFLSGSPSSQLIKGLPTYAWDHEVEYWHESRYARAMRMRSDQVHGLLGHLTPDSTEQDMRWRHYLRISELKWLLGHRLQNITVFPAAGYIVSVLEASMLLCKDESVKLIEILDVNIDSALVFDNDDVTIEILLGFTNIKKSNNKSIEADFRYHATSGKGTEPLKLKASGHVRIQLGPSYDKVLPPRLARWPNLVPVSEKKFYEMTSDLGYQYGGQFASLERIERKLGVATGSISMTEDSRYLIHPGTLDAAFQSTFLTYAAPDDGSSRLMHIPKRIRRLTFNPYLCEKVRHSQAALSFDAVHAVPFPHTNMSCDIDVYSADFDHAMIQVEGLECVPFSRPTVKDDREFFSHTVWDVLNPDAQIACCKDSEIVRLSELGNVLERVAGFYLRVLDQEVPINHPLRIEGPYIDVLQCASSTTSHSGTTKSGLWQRSWQDDTPEVIAAVCRPYMDTIDMQLLLECGQNLARIVKGDELAQETSNLMTKWYSNGSGISTCMAHTARILKQIVHRYPHMHILEACREMGTTTPTLLSEIGQKFASYTVTAPNSGIFDIKQALPDIYEDKVTQKVFDLSNDTGNGFPDRSFDVIIASLVLHDSQTLKKALSKARRLLKPGGYLIVLELRPSLPYFLSVIFWANGTSPRQRSSAEPALSLLEWDDLLRDTGFSGIDTSSSEESEVTLPFSTFVSQATDDKIEFLRDPLSAMYPTTSSESVFQDLLILGGSSLKMSRVVNQLSIVLSPKCGRIKTARSLLDLADIDLSPNTVILNLTDMDGNEFKQLDLAKWEVFQKLVSHMGTVVWVTHGRLADNPHANMVLGLVRGAARDNSTLDYLLLDIEDANMVQHHVIAEALLRYKAASHWRERDSLHFSVENELVLDKTGRFSIPRLMMNKDLNDRFNSNWREIRGRAKPGIDNIGISTSEFGWDTVLEPLPSRKAMQLRTTHSIVSPIKIANRGCTYVTIGKDTVTNDKKIVLSSKNNSMVCPQKELSITVKVSPDSEARFLWLTTHHLLASFILKGFSKGDQVLVHEPSNEFATAMAAEAASLEVQMTFTTTKLDSPAGWIFIHPAASEKTVSRTIHQEFSLFVNMALDENADSIGDVITSVLPVDCRKDTLQSSFGQKASDIVDAHVDGIRSRLARAVSWATLMLEESQREQVATVPIDALPKGRDQLKPLTVIEWSTTSELPVRVQPVDKLVSFSDKKTYWLVGLTGGLGLSLCEWMVKQGARYFVITSRNPKVEKAWLDGMYAKGVTVKISACDVTQRDQVVRLHSEICSSLPTIGGVAQGAMILEDVAIQDMTLEQLSRVTKPKVEGSIYLNDLFQEDSLDFFVFFSSVSSIVGNHGQANYAAANTFMASLAEQRRRRGLAASVMDIGAVFGVGYITRIGKESLMGNVTLRTGGYVRTSERDFHQLFGEAVIAGQSGSSGSIELVSGVRKVSRREEHQPIWEAWPRMSHFILGDDGPDDMTNSGTDAKAPVKVRLAEAQNQEQVYTVVFDALIQKLRSLFQIEVSNLTRHELGAMRLDQMGIDSLTAVEIRGWLMKTLEVNIPVLKIMNGVSVSELVDTAIENLPSRLVPSLDKSCVEDTSAQSAVSSSEMSSNSDTAPEDHFDNDQVDLYQSELSSDQEYPASIKSSLMVLKSVPVSFTQARFYPSGLFLEDKVGLNHTAWARVTGAINPERLRQALRALGQQHEILRTAFYNQDGRQMQHILESSLINLEHRKIENEQEVTDLVLFIQKEHIYDVAKGETMRVILLSRSATENFLVIGVHPLVLDATSLQIYLRWLAFHYTSPNTRRRVKQFVEASEQRHADYTAGKFQAELGYWRREFATPITPLPLLNLARVQERPKLKAYENIRSTLKIDVDTKKQILKICRQVRATPFHFYLAVLRVLLMQYTSNDNEDVTIAVAENGRGYDAEEMDVIGPLYNLVLVRLLSKSSTKFENLLEFTRDKTYAALENSKLPYPVLVEELGLQRTAKDYPFVQVFADYRVGQRKTMRFGENNELIMMGFDFNVPYDVFLDTIDEPDGDCTHYLFLRNDLFGRDEAEELASAYKSLVLAFVKQPGMALGEVHLSELEKPAGSGNGDTK